MIKHIAKLGVAATLIAAAPLALAQTTTSTTTGTTTPGIPNTGAGGDAATNALVLAITGAAALGGIGYLATRRGIRA